MEILLTGIGGQGVQLVGKVLAQAAVNEGRHAMVYGEYGGEMRGGKSIVNVVIGATRLRGLPVISNASHVVALHQKFWDEVLPRIASDALIVADAAVGEQLDAPGWKIETLPGIKLAEEAGNAMAAGFVMAAGFAKITGIVKTHSLIGAMKELVPSYRRQHVEINERALLSGAAAAEALSAPVAHSAV